MIDIQISFGEALDRFSILHIKYLKIKDVDKKENTRLQMMELKEKIKEISPKIEELYQKLFKVNEEIWDVEEKIRELLPKALNNYEEYTKIAINTPIKNDLRAKYKKQIDQIMGDVAEIKSHKNI